MNMNPARRDFLAMLALPALALAAGPVAAQAWPAKPIVILNGYPAGGDSDAMARLYAEKLSQRLGQTVLVENRPGASGTIAAGSVARAAPDGYTLLFVPSTFAIAQLTLPPSPSTAHDVVKDYTPVIKTGNIPLLAVAPAGLGIGSMKALIAQAKAGKSFTYGSPGTGSPMHIVGEMLNRAAGVKLTHVPYRGVAPIVTDLLGNHVSIGWVTPAAVGGHLQSGKLVPLATSEPTRSSLMPDVPTLVELGYPDVAVSAWMGLLGPKGLPERIVTTLNTELNAILKMPDVAEKMRKLGIEPVGGAPSVLARQVAEDHERFARLVKELDIRAQ